MHVCFLLHMVYPRFLTSFQREKKTSRHYRATDYRHLLLLLPFIRDNLFLDEVETFNTANQGQPKLIDPSAELVAVANTFLATRFSVAITPPKTDDDIITLQGLSHMNYSNYTNYSNYMNCSNYSNYCCFLNYSSYIFQQLASYV